MDRYMNAGGVQAFARMTTEGRGVVSCLTLWSLLRCTKLLGLPVVVSETFRKPLEVTHSQDIYRAPALPTPDNFQVFLKL